MRIIYLFSLLLLGGTLFLSSSQGPGTIQMQDRTGGPLSNGFCGNCHAVGAFNPSMTLEVLDGSDPVTNFEGGTTYTMRITVNADAGAQVYGFQAVALSGADNQSAGSFTPGDGQHLATVGGREYVEHNMRSEENVFETQWTAPANGTGPVRFYAATVAANNAAGSGGDGAVFLTEPVVVNDPSVNTFELPALAEKLNVYPNPVGDQLNVRASVNETTTAEVRLFNAAGQQVFQVSTDLVAGENNLQYNLAQLPAGRYTLQLSNGIAASMTTVIKQ